MFKTIIVDGCPCVVELGVHKGKVYYIYFDRVPSHIDRMLLSDMLLGLDIKEL